MEAEQVTIYTQEGALLGVLEHADEITYTLAHNELWTASFSLPSGDLKNALCQAHNLVKIPDGTRDIGLYRIVGMPTSEETAAGGRKTYSLEHVMATLLDDVLFGYHELGGADMNTAQVIEAILAQQTTPRWALGVCEFDDEYAYKFENTTLLSAILSLGNVLTAEYTWDFDTSTRPWTVNLRCADATPGCGIHYRRNMIGIEKSMDASTLVTRLYLLGYGEGVNQLTIRPVNGGIPYIDADTASIWGIKASVYADTRIEDPATLMARGAAILARYKNPYISYTAAAMDLSRLTGQAWDSYMPGKLVRVMDSEHGLDFTARIACIGKRDVRGRPGEIEITIANAPRDAAESINTLADRMGISELYSQGATNLYSQQYADNADENHPATMRVYVPSGCVRINRMLLSFKLSAFRAYSTGAETGGASERSSNAGGGSTQVVAQEIVTTTAVTGGPISGHEGSTGGNTGYARDASGNAMNATGASATQSTGHTHGMTHYHNFSHTHNVTTVVTVPGHTITMPGHSHTFSVSAHAHEIVYGIYEGGRALHVTIRVDGQDIPAAEMESEMDLTPYLAKDADGRITRGTWHEIAIYPDGLTRIEANVFVQAFVQSVGGGDY